MANQITAIILLQLVFVFITVWLVKSKRSIGNFSLVRKEEWEKHVANNKNLVSYDTIKLPARKTARSIGYDIFNTLNSIYLLQPDEEVVIPTGIKVLLGDNVGLFIIPRSGQGFKYLRLANTVGLIDPDYYDNQTNNGHIMVKLRNEGPNAIELKPGVGIAQALFIQTIITNNDVATDVARTGGFGSTG